MFSSILDYEVNLRFWGQIHLFRNDFFILNNSILKSPGTLTTIYLQKSNKKDKNLESWRKFICVELVQNALISLIFLPLQADCDYSYQSVLQSWFRRSLLEIFHSRFDFQLHREIFLQTFLPNFLLEFQIWQKGQKHRKVVMQWMFKISESEIFRFDSV